ncbi:MAG: hypothetical protein NVS1B11_26110 [Terriglobales bacterium]
MLPPAIPAWLVAEVEPLADAVAVEVVEVSDPFAIFPLAVVPLDMVPLLASMLFASPLDDPVTCT